MSHTTLFDQAQKAAISINNILTNQEFKKYCIKELIKKAKNSKLGINRKQLFNTQRLG